MKPSPRNILLTGAGFTKNFGGLLGQEVWERIFNDAGVRKHRRIVDLLRKLEPDFETAYSKVQSDEYSGAETGAMLAAVERVFTTMDETIREFHQWEEVPCLHGTADLIRMFSGSAEECGFFFTLNQDLFVERRIVDKTFDIQRGQLWPLGIKARRQGGSFLGDRKLSSDEIKQLPRGKALDDTKENEHRHQRFAYVKLHGSTGWHDSSGREVMVVGGGKERQIEREPMLAWYFDVFRTVMNEGRHRLLVIGYSFRDPHVNQVLIDAINGPGLDIAIISTQRLKDFEAALSKYSAESDQSGVMAICEKLSEPGSRFYQRRLVDVLPPNARGSKPKEWEEIRSYLLSD